MATSKTFLILVVCLFQVYAEPVDIPKESADLLVNFFKQLGLIRQDYLNAVHTGNGITFEQYVQNLGADIKEFENNGNDLLENIEENNPDYPFDVVENAIVTTLRGVIKLFVVLSERDEHQEYKEYVLSTLAFIKEYGTFTDEDYDNAVVKFENERAAIWDEFLNEFDGMDEDETVASFEEKIAVAIEKLEEPAKHLIAAVEEA